MLTLFDNRRKQVSVRLDSELIIIPYVCLWGSILLFLKTVQRKDTPLLLLLLSSPIRTFRLLTLRAKLQKAHIRNIKDKLELLAALEKLAGASRG